MNPPITFGFTTECYLCHHDEAYEATVALNIQTGTKTDSYSCCRPCAIAYLVKQGYTTEDAAQIISDIPTPTGHTYNADN